MNPHAECNGWGEQIDAAGKGKVATRCSTTAQTLRGHFHQPQATVPWMGHRMVPGAVDSVDMLSAAILPVTPKVPHHQHVNTPW